MIFIIKFACCNHVGRYKKPISDFSECPYCGRNEAFQQLEHKQHSFDKQEYIMIQLDRIATVQGLDYPEGFQ